MLHFTYTDNACPFCGDPDNAVYYQKQFQQGSVQWSICKQDGLIYQSPRLDNETIQALFDSEMYASGGTSDASVAYYRYEESEHARLDMGRKKIQLLEGHLPNRTLQVLEIGCATGSFLKACQDRGHIVRGIDASSAFASYGQKHYNLDIVVGLFEDFEFEDAVFDVVAIFGSLSSLFDPVRAFRKVARLLVPGGVIVFNTPVLDGWLARLYGKRLWMFAPSSQVLYTKQTVRTLLETAGFQPLEIKTDFQVVSIEKLAFVTGFRFLGEMAGRYRKLSWTMPVPSVVQVIAKVK